MARSPHSQLSAAANTQVTGWWLGGQVGLASFISAAACFFDVEFSGYAVAQKGSGVHMAPGPGRQTESLRDMGSSKSRLRSSVCRLGTWPVRVAGIQSHMALARVMNYLLRFSTQLLLQPACRTPTPSPRHSEAVKVGANPPATQGASKRQRPEAPQI